jgi:hypothetical protein
LHNFINLAYKLNLKYFKLFYKDLIVEGTCLNFNSSVPELFLILSFILLSLFKHVFAMLNNKKTWFIF